MFLSEVLTDQIDILHEHAAPLSARLIDGINQSEARRRALMLFCFVYWNVNAKVRSLSVYCLMVIKVIPSRNQKENY